MGSYIESAVIIGVPTNELSTSIDSAYELIDKNEDLIISEGLRIFGQEFEDDFTQTYIGFRLVNNGNNFGYVTDENFFIDNREEIKRKKELFFKTFNETPKIIFTYYRY